MKGIQPAIAPALLSHLPMFKPMTFSVTAIVRPTTETIVKYVVLVESDCADGPATNNAFDPANNSSVGKYGKFVTQYIQPLRNPAKGPNARLLQTYRPPSSGYRDDNSSTVKTSGTNRNAAATTQRTRALGPAAAAIAIQRKLHVVTT